ncbi:type VI secretion protein [Ruminococcaceae bacterium OttesenSCG-928-L11]|nr:type VI secretion protein [Ruminococcaceae bacterium OttesenSCG-928-L11]
MILPGTVKFFTDYYICGNTYRCCWAIREYPTSTSQQALLQHLGEKDGVTLKIYTRTVTCAEERRLYSQAEKSNKLKRNQSNDIRENVIAEQNLQDVTNVIATTLKNREPLVHCAVFIELMAFSRKELEDLQGVVQAELSRSKINMDHLLLRQQEGFQSVMPSGHNVLGAQYERVLPASSVANLYPFCYSGKTDPRGHYLGRDKYGSNIIVDFDRRADDKTNGNILILGNSGQGKSYLLKDILYVFRASGKQVLALDAEHEYEDLTHSLGGTYIDLMSGDCKINVLEPKVWQENQSPAAILGGHISFLLDFFRSYKNFGDQQCDAISIMLQKVFERFGLTDGNLKHTSAGYPILSDLYEMMEHEYRHYDNKNKELYTAETLQDTLLGLHSICVGPDSVFFNGHTSIPADAGSITFGLKDLLEAGEQIKNPTMFNLLAYMSNVLLTQGHAVAAIDEFYLFLGNLRAVEYIRNFMKRVRKFDSNVILASQNIEDYFLPNIVEYTKPLFAIPTHKFFFNMGDAKRDELIENLGLTESEYGLIAQPERGSCLFKCGSERYNLKVIAPPHREKLFGAAGGK